MYTLQDLATGGAAAVAVSTALTQALKRLIELKWGPKDPAHDTLVEMGGLIVSILVVLIAALLTTPATPGSVDWWHAAIAAVVAGVGIKYGASGLYKALTSGKIDGDVLGQLAALAVRVENLTVSMPGPAPKAPSIVLPAGAAPAPVPAPPPAPAPATPAPVVATPLTEQGPG